MLIQEISKAFGGVSALRDVTFDVRPGEVHGLIGHNGSGKSTLMRVLTGFYEPDSGSVGFEAGENLHVAAVHQDLCLRDDMQVVENFGISTRFDRSLFGHISWRTQRRLAIESLRGLGVSIRPDALVGTLAPAEKAAVAIARAVSEIRRSGGPGVLVVDEATAYFSRREIGVVRGILRRLAEDGHTVIFISHNLTETLKTCDRITVLRSGEVVDTFASDDTDERALIAAMLGRSLEAYYPDATPAPLGDSDRAPRLRVTDLADDLVSDFSLDVGPGEIVGVTGVLGTGFDRIPYLLVGANRSRNGVMTVDGSVVPMNPSACRTAGVSLVPANRAAHGLWMGESATWNYTLPRLSTFWRSWRIDTKKEKAASTDVMTQFGVLPNEPTLPMSAFSGGNAQKVLLASRLDPGRTKVLLLHEPTQGVDAGAKVDILTLLHASATTGTAVLIFSSDHEEIVNTCSRVLVLNTQGRVVADLPTAALDEDSLVAACIAAG